MMSWIEYHTAPDELGRRQYTLRWFADYIPGHPAHGPYIAGQVFFANPATNGHDKLSGWPNYAPQ